MLFEVAGVSKGFSTLLTFDRFLAGMDSFVPPQRLRSVVCRVADVTLVRFFIGMDCIVAAQIAKL